MDQEAAIRANVAQTFQRLGLPAPTSDVPVDVHGFDVGIIKSDYLIGQNQRVFEVSFGLSKNSLEAHLSKIKRRM
jgi:hypothetical protein